LASFKVKNKELSQQEVRAKKQVPSRLAVSSVLAEIPSEMVVSTRDSLFFFLSVKRNFVHVSLRISFGCSFAEAL
jgi:acetylglutamate synthase